MTTQTKVVADNAQPQTNKVYRFEICVGVQSPLFAPLSSDFSAVTGEPYFVYPPGRRNSIYVSRVRVLVAKVIHSIYYECQKVILELNEGSQIMPVLV